MRGNLNTGGAQVEENLKIVESKWSFVLALVLLMFLGLIPLQWYFFSMYLVFILGATFCYFKLKTQLKTELLFGVYITAESSLQKYNKYHRFRLVMDMVLALFSAVITAVFIFSLTIYHCGFIIIGVSLGSMLSQFLLRKFLLHAHEQYHRLARLNWNQIGAVLGAAIAYFLVEYSQNAAQDFAAMKSLNIANQVIETYKHPIPLIQHFTRTVAFMDLQVLKLRDNLGGGISWIVYGYLIIPSLLPLYGTVCAAKGSYLFVLKCLNLKKNSL